MFERKEWNTIEQSDSRKEEVEEEEEEESKKTQCMYRRIDVPCHARF